MKLIKKMVREILRLDLTPLVPFRVNPFRVNPSPHLWRGGYRGRGKSQTLFTTNRAPWQSEGKRS
jgi:hypothetical protein